MPTIIYFGESGFFVTVAERAEQVSEAFTEADGRLPLRLAEARGDQIAASEVPRGSGLW